MKFNLDGTASTYGPSSSARRSGATNFRQVRQSIALVHPLSHKIRSLSPQLSDNYSATKWLRVHSSDRSGKENNIFCRGNVSGVNIVSTGSAFMSKGRVIDAIVILENANTLFPE